MDMFVVRGGRPLAGTVRVGGSKNAALPILAASLLADGETRLRGVPDLVDVRTMHALLATLGVDVGRDHDGTTRLRVVDESPVVADYELVRRMRASVCVLGPLLAKRGRARVSLPGGCNIGDRPIDLHLRGLRALGADVRIERGYVVAEAKRLRGAVVQLGGPQGSTVTGTANVLTAACLADGITTIESAACEPEIVDLGQFLNRMGARITGLGTSLLRIEGVDRLVGCEHELIPDRIEAATLMIAAAATRGCVTIENAPLGHLAAVVAKLREIGAEITPGERGALAPCWGDPAGPPPIRVEPAIDPSRWVTSTGCSRPPLAGMLVIDAAHPLRPAECTALPYPGLPTDVQAQLVALLATVPGIGVVTDRVFPDRFLHLPELVRLGARIRREGPTAIVHGVDRLGGANVMASDLRASAALAIAALTAEGETVVRRIYHLDRGYESLETKLVALGADVRRVVDKADNVPASLRAGRAA